MTLDRDQIKRDAEWVLNQADPYQALYQAESAGNLACQCLALLTELEKRDQAAALLIQTVGESEARLAKVPPLVKALKELTEGVHRARARGRDSFYWPDHVGPDVDEPQDRAIEALAAWEADD